ncbi:TetR family transcriptional regulator [Streptomyces spinosirectus]|jgi:AcrR family transcriptional regulator|uniref:TetR/AcrR family transcriptional regulator n=1 Tax=Streptomyces TaxID=1883 RepID=UPI000D35C8E7|nr:MULTISPECIES: TetR family transcriptional regulator [Streptomyces]MBY8339517.1 TetR family transcriptional regulator [Streptomyces plumbidurans]PTM93247.1 TetR family transcriptional regulator [Streptomyces sp. VMFN-G11Ma]UIR15956.1 TetR family transcriptional regulator [Streptomyces spinosirectus]
MSAVSTPPTASSSTAPGSSASSSTTSPSTASAPVRRDAEATKAAILRAARHLLARHAHADITLKAVAERAGVSAPLILKYFGNKDTLFARVMSFEADADALLDAPLDALGRHMVRHVLVSQTRQGADPLLRIVFAPLHGEQGDILRANFRTQVTERLTARLDGPDAGLRAELAVAGLLGLGVMFGIARTAHVRGAALEEIVDRYAPTVQAQLTPGDAG